MKELDFSVVAAIGQQYLGHLGITASYEDPDEVEYLLHRAGVDLPPILTNLFRQRDHDGITAILLMFNGKPEFERVLLRLASPLEYGGDRQEHTRALVEINGILWAEGLEIVLDGRNPVIRDLETSEKETKMTPSQITDTKRWLEKIAAYERGDPDAVAEANEHKQFVGLPRAAMFGGAEHNAVVHLHRNGLIELPNSWSHNPEKQFSLAGIYAYRLTDAGREFLAMHNTNPASGNNRQLPAVIRSPYPMAAGDNPGSVTKHQLRAFITHGKKHDYIEGTKEVCRQLRIEPVVATESPNLAQYVAEKVKQGMDSCDIHIVLLTQDEGNEPSQNAIGELHYAAFSHPDSIIIYRERGVKLPSNLSGMATGWLDGQWQFKLLQELQALIPQVPQK